MEGSARAHLGAANMGRGVPDLVAAWLGAVDPGVPESSRADARRPADDHRAGPPLVSGAAARRVVPLHSDS
jgi:hypothetical protein